MLDAFRSILAIFDREFTALLISLPRLYAFLAMSQLLNSSVVPGMARTACVLSLASIVVPINLEYAVTVDRSLAGFALLFAKEYCIGFVLGYLVGWLFWAVASAGALIDNQRGAAIASSIDPLQGHESSPFGNLFSQVFLTYLFTIGAVLPMIGLLYKSFVIWPVNRSLPVISDTFPVMILALFDEAMRLMFLFAGPVVAVMFMAEFALAMVSRFAPQIQVFILIFYMQTLFSYAAGRSSIFELYGRMFYEQMKFGEKLQKELAVPSRRGPQ
jgi:type III secretion protein T